MSQIDISNLTFAYAGSHDNIFENVSFQIDTDWKLGFTGRNGRGKTTFLRLLMGNDAYSGKISASTEFAYFPYDVADETQNTIDIIAGIYPDFRHWELARGLALLAVPEEVLDRPFETLSKGERTKVLLATLFLKENSFLLIDEPTNHLDMEARALLGEYLRSQKGFILVSHDRRLLDSCADHILSINRTDIEIQRGNLSTWLINKERTDQFERERDRKLKKDIKRLEAAAVRTSDWSLDVEKTKHGTKVAGLRPDRGHIGHKAAKMMKRSKEIERRRQASAAEKSGLLKNIESADSLKIRQDSYHTDLLASLKGVSIFYGEKPACENVSFAVERGDRIALCGRNGSGKSSILKLIRGEDIRCIGDFHKGSQLRISYVSQNTAGLGGSLSDYAVARDIEESLFKAILRKLGLERIQFEKDMGDFSSGQKKKVLLARSLSEKAHLHIWDEPLNFIDVVSRMQIEALLLEARPTILFVEHDSAFCDAIATKRVTLP